MLVRYIAFAFTLLPFSFHDLTADDSGRQASQLNKHVDKLFQRWASPDSPGYAVGIIRDGRFVHKRGYGMANLDEGIPITPETVFHVMSLSKSFTTACAARAMDQGRFAPTDDVRTYLPELRDFGKTITIQHLLTCRSGLRDFWHGMILLGRDPNDAYSSADVFDLILRQKSLIFEPGERWGYSNTDWFLLSMIIERTAGRSLRKFADQQFFEPLGMQHTFFDDSPDVTRKHRALGYGHNGQSFIKLDWNNESVGPCGLNTTLDDMLIWDSYLHNRSLPEGKYLAEFLNHGELLGNKRCLSAFPDEKYRGLSRFWFTGGGMGFMAHFVRFPDQRLSIIAFGNNSTSKGWHESSRVLPRIADLYLANQVEDVDAERDGEQPEWDHDAAPIELSGQRLEQLSRSVGAYRLPWGDYIELVVSTDELCVHRICEPWVAGQLDPLVAVGENRFRSARGYREFELSFETEGDGATTASTDRPTVKLRFQNGDTQLWEPVQFTTHDNDDLQEYAGEYYCDELESVYRVSASDGKLFVQYNFGRKRPYRPTLGDSFIPAKEIFVIPVDFSRDRNGSVTGYKTGFDRSGDLIFTKRSP